MMKPERLKVRVAQLCSGEDPKINIEHVDRVLESTGNADLIVFPENSLFLRIRPGTKTLGHALNEEFWQRWQRWSVAKRCTILLCTPIKESDQAENQHNVNAIVQIDATGVKIVYRKIHLFDVDVEGEKPQRESDFLKAGQLPATIEVLGWKIGLSICYDIRFAELYLQYGQQEVDLILVPAAFLVATGKAHWQVLLRARAIENQCYVVAAAQAGSHFADESERHTYGHSLVVNPWGEVLAESLLSGPDILDVELEQAKLEKVRRQIPMANHRRLSYNLS